MEADRSRRSNATKEFQWFQKFQSWFSTDASNRGMNLWTNLGSRSQYGWNDWNHWNIWNFSE